MALKFRRKIKIAPGVSLNISKSGVSASVGPKGLTTNVKPGRRAKTTASALGVYDSHSHKGSGGGILLLAILAAIFMAGLGIFF